MEININRPDYYKRNGDTERTRARLEQLNAMGMVDLGLSEFGVRGVVSGLYIERVWNYDQKAWDSYIKWAGQIIAFRKKLKQQENAK